MSNGCHWKQRHRLRGRAGREAAGGGIRDVRGMVRGEAKEPSTWKMPRGQPGCF